MEIKTRKQALIDCDTVYYTGKSCKHGHFAKRYTSNGACHTCHTINMANYQKNLMNLKYEGKLKVSIIIKKEYMELIKALIDIIHNDCAIAAELDKWVKQVAS